MEGITYDLPVRQIVSGGQTGVDQAALQVAIDLGISHGGWCPRGRRCETGRIPARFRLQETQAPQYWVRTEQNVMDSEGTLILHRGPMGGGTALTRRMANRHARPWYAVDLLQPPDIVGSRDWLRDHDVTILNVAGPRESTAPGIYDQSRAFLLSIFRPLG